MSFLDTFAQTYTYTTYTTTSGGEALSSGVVIGFIFLYIFILAVAYVVSALLMARIFKKAGAESWIAWVPVYNTWKFLEIGGQQGYWAILAFLPLVGIVSVVFMVIAAYNIGLNLGKQGVFVLLYLFVPIVWLIWLAVDSSTWKSAATDTTPPYQPPTPPAPLS